MAEYFQSISSARRSSFVMLARTIRADFRSLSPYLLRFAIFLVLVFAISATQQEARRSGAPGLTLFFFILASNVFAIVLAALGFFAPAITEEKEEGTLDLLKLANIGPLSLILGKAGSRLFSAVVILLCQVPFLILVLGFGGVSPGQLQAGFMYLFSFLMATAGLALLASSASQRTRSAVGLTIMFLVTFYIILPFLYSGSAPRLALSKAQLFQSLSPYDRLEAILYSDFSGPLVSGFELWNFAIAAAGFLISWLGFHSFNDSQWAPVEVLSLVRERLQSLTLARTGSRRRCWSNALIWKDFEFVTGGFPGFFLRLVLYGLVTAGVIAFVSFYKVNIPGRYSYWYNADYIVEVFGAHFGRVYSISFILQQLFFVLFLLELGLFTSRFLSHELRDKTLSVLTMLPQSLTQVLLRKWLGCVLGLVPVLCFLCAAVLADKRSFMLTYERLSRHDAQLLLFVGVLFYVQLTATLSLWLKWGILPASIGLIIGSIVCLKLGTTVFASAVGVCSLILMVFFRKQLRISDFMRDFFNSNETKDDSSSQSEGSSSTGFSLPNLILLLVLLSTVLLTIGRFSDDFSFTTWLKYLKVVFFRSQYLAYLGVTFVIHLVLYMFLRWRWNMAVAANGTVTLCLVTLQLTLRLVAPNPKEQLLLLSGFLVYLTVVMHIHMRSSISQRALWS